jgi:hypothetical protein
MTLRPIQLKWGAALAGLAAFAGCYVLLAYIVLPEAWRHYEHQKALAGLTMVTRTKNGIPGDPMNIGLVGSQDDVLCAMNTAGWYPADPVTLRSSLQIVGSVVLKRPYSEAPMSGLYFQDRRQDFGFEKPVGNSADRRHHVRFWQVIERGEEGRPVWLGAVTFDRSVGFSHNDARITHHIAPDIDTDRDLLTADLGDAHVTKTLYEVTGIGPTIDGRNGEGDPYYTDGEIKISVLVDGCTERSPSVAELSNPPFVRFKNAVWNAIAKLFLTGRTAADAAGE